MDARTLESGYWRAYQDFYRWGSIWTSARAQNTLWDRMRHLAYAGGWKKFEPLWDLAIRSRQVLHALPLLETVLSGFGHHNPQYTPPSSTRLGEPDSSKRRQGADRTNLLGAAEVP